MKTFIQRKYLKMSSVKRQQFCVGVSVLTNSTVDATHASKQYYFEFERNIAVLFNIAFIGHTYV